MANFDQNAEFEPLRVEISILSQRIRDFQRKISRKTCLNRFFWKFFRKFVQGVPHSKTQNRRLGCQNDIFRQNKHFGDFFHVIWDRKIAKAKLF